MRCAVLHAFPPHRHNLQAPTANPYQLLRFAPPGMDIDLFYFSGKEECRASSERCIEALRLSSSLEIPRPSGLSKLYHLAGAQARGLPGSVGMFPPLREFVRRVNDSRPDLVWMYPHWLADWTPRLECRDVVVTGPDSAVLHNERALQFGDLGGKEARRQRSLLRKNVRLERLWGSSRARMHMVGAADAQRYIELNEGRAEAFFVPHPLYDHSRVKEDLIHKDGKTVVMFSGGGDTVFTGSHLRRAIAAISSARDLSDKIELRFLGRGYEGYASTLRRAGFECLVQTWVDDYEGELAEAQVHVFPIAVGTGTKGKVLTALATGSLCVCSDVALENIAVRPGTDCLRYDRPEDVGPLLEDLLARRELYAKVAESGARRVAEKHDPAKVAKEFWDLALSPGTV